MKNLLLILLLAVPAGAIELSLEENKAEKGTVGFIDMERVFREYPETKKAKEQFEADVSAKRLELKRRRGAIDDLKSEIARLTVERERALREGLTESPVVPPAPPVQTMTVSTDVAASTPPAPGILQNLPGIGPAPSTETVAVSTMPAAPEGPDVPARPPEANAQPEMPGIEKVSAAQRVREIEDRIAAKQKEIEDGEKAFKEYEAKSEQELLDLEKHRVKLLLGKLYEIVQEVAKDEGISVVVDKKAILYGQKAVDLTDKLLERVK